MVSDQETNRSKTPRPRNLQRPGSEVGDGGRGVARGEHCTGRPCSSGELDCGGCCLQQEEVVCTQLESTEVFHAGWHFRKCT